MAAIIHYSDTNKKRSSNFANLLVDGKITVREKGKRYIIGLFKISDFESRVSDTDADQFDFPFKSLVAFDFAIHLVDRGSLPLTEGSVHAEYLNDNDVSPYFRNCEAVFACHP